MNALQTEEFLLLRRELNANFNHYYSREDQVNVAGTYNAELKILFEEGGKFRTKFICDR